MSPTFSPYRLDIARRRRGLTQKELAEAVGIHPQSLRAYSQFRRSPEPDTIERLASSLAFPVSFFFGLDRDRIPITGTSYRALSRAPSRDRMQAEATGEIGTLFSDWLQDRFELPIVDFPQFDVGDPESAAGAVRSYWGLGVLSISNIVALLEMHGARVFALATDTPTLDAFSFWRGSVPYVFLNTSKSAERTRMDVAHELGHLVMHFKGGAMSRDRHAEVEAQRFAGALLMPRDSIAANFPFARLSSLDQFRESKRFWNVSLISLVVRMNELGYLNDYRYRTLFIEASKRGFTRKEPDGCEPDFSLVLDKLFNPHGEGAITVSSVARQISVYPAEIYNLTRGLVPFPVLVS